MAVHINPKLLAGPIGCIARAWSSTFRFETNAGYAAMEKLRESGKPLILCVWHDELFTTLQLMRGKGVTAIISRSRDGELIARIAEGFGFRTVRGSSTRGGSAALVGLLKGLSGVNPVVAVTVDGPRGPRHKVKDGAVYLAQKTGGYLVSGRVFMDNRWVFNSWDRFQVPKPFSKVRVFCSEAYAIPSELTREEFRAEIDRLEQVMHATGGGR